MDELTKADRAKALLDDPLIKEAFSVVREKYRDMIEQTPLADDTALLDIRKMLHLLKEVKDHLRQAVETGTVIRFRDIEQERQSFLGDKIWRTKK